MNPLCTPLQEIILKQLHSHFLPPKQILESSDVENALQDFEHCLSHIRGKYFDMPLSLNDFYHSDKYAVFLYYLSRSAFFKGKVELATQVYYLNKILHGLDLFYEVQMPKVFMLTHPLGTVLGRARYGEYFCAYQNCTIGSTMNEKGEGVYPTLGRGVVLFAGAKVIGDCAIGDNVIFGANTFLLNTNVPSNSIVLGIYPTHRILASKHDVIAEFFHPSYKEVETNM